MNSAHFYLDDDFFSFANVATQIRQTTDKLQQFSV